MTWTVTFQQDTALPDVGSVTATWSAPGESLTLGPERIDSKRDAPAFVTKAKASLVAYQAKQAKINTIAAAIEAALNA